MTWSSSTISPLPGTRGTAAGGCSEVGRGSTGRELIKTLLYV